MKRLFSILALVCAPLAYGQGGVPASPIYFSGPTGRPLAGATVTFCTSAGTGFPCAPLASIFTNAGLTLASPNPVTTDGNGNIPVIFAAPGVYILSVTGSGITPTLVTATVAGTGAGNVTTSGANAFIGNNTHSGTEGFTGSATTITDLNGGKYVDGTKYATLAAADAACVAAVSCVIDMRGNSTALALGTFDPGSTIPTTVLLGPYNYTLTQLILRTGLKVYGMRGFTVITSTSTSADMVVLGTGSGAIQAVRLDGFNIQCGAGNASQIAFHIVVPVGVGGLWYSDFWDLIVGGGGTNGCGGGEFLFDGNNGGATGLNQFIDFYRVRAFRPTNGAPVFRATGLNGQFSFNQSEFDGPTPNDSNKTNFQIDDGTQTFRAPYSFGLNNVTIQQAAGTTGLGILLQGVTGVEINSGHYENLSGFLKATVGAHFGSWGTIVTGSTFDGVGIASGSGFITSTDIGSSVSFNDNDVNGTPDAWFIGTSNRYVSSRGTINHSAGSAQPAPSNNRPIAGFDPDGPTIKLLTGTTGCVTGASAGANCTTTINFTTAFPDTNYAAYCGGNGTTSGTPANSGLAKNTGSVVHTTLAVTAIASQFTTIECIVIRRAP